MSAPMPNPEPGISLEAIVRETAAAGVKLARSGSAHVTGVRQDSRRIEPGDLFVARAGGVFDGARFAVEAVRAGAVAVLVPDGRPLPDLGVPVLSAADVRLAVGLAAEAVYDHPTERLRVVGITGTNGKTTTTWLVAQAIDAAGGAAARLGTLGFAFRDDVDAESLTTPEADDVSRFAARAFAGGASHLAMEVSSIALTQQRVEAVHFAVAAFTNLTQDHLDFHGTMEAYAAAKERFFVELHPDVAVVNIDGEGGAEIAARAPGRVLTVGRSAGADIRALDVRIDADGIGARVRLPSGEVDLRSRLAGAHNLENLLLSLGIVEALGLDASRAALGLSDAAAAPGRLERCDEPGDDVTVLVDYAHTPDALERVLVAVRGLARGAVHCVFGCGGDRDPGKRPRMGEAVGRAADRATVTNDNPRSEDPEAIAAAILPGLRKGGASFDVVLDRRAAIEGAILGAAPGDLVLLAGKGHEPYQLTLGEKKDFDDRIEAKRALAMRRGRRA